MRDSHNAVIRVYDDAGNVIETHGPAYCAFCCRAVMGVFH